MASDHSPTGTPSSLLVKFRAGSERELSLAAGGIARGSEVLLRTSIGDADPGFTPASEATWVRLAATDSPWDQAHAMMRTGSAATGEILAVEPEFDQDWPHVGSATCEAKPRSGDGGRATGPHDRWHLDDAFSGLSTANASVDAGLQRRVLVAHLDTGYDPNHAERPRHIAQGERNFVRGGDPESATDVTAPGGLRNHGHGTGTIGILAGPGFGGARDVEVLPIRIADSVVRFTTGTMAQGFEYALSKGARVLSMSMGGLASEILADAVNKCYAHGLVMVAAAGNNFAGLPVRSIVYPARMRRVVAACGVMADFSPYFDLAPDTMQGCYGPDRKMDTALSGFTPNIPWPLFGCGSAVRENGEGTSSATPQIAAAAALWIARHMEALDALPDAWMRGEAVRQALFRSARMPTGGEKATLGAGAISATRMLALDPLSPDRLKAEPRASAAWAWVKLISGRGVGVLAEGSASANRMLALELAQLAQRDPAMAELADDPESTTLRKPIRRALLEAAEASPLASKALKAAVGSKLHGRSVPALRPPAFPEEGHAAAPSAVPAPDRRRLRIFALDPSLGGSLNSYESQIATIGVKNEAGLRPGPVGEYLEVVDVDPASNRFYPPVDLNDPNLLLQDGLKPSEGDPSFHQQMVYAVAMRTIEQFELALGRPALWAARPPVKKGPNEFVRRLRIHPHALRQQNAYYSPDRKALLFGYFPASSQISDLTPPGTMIFSCLSADIIAHETTHALLDGQARSYAEPSNPDVRAFHEAFADIVALFQQYTYRDLVRREIAGSHADLSAFGLIGGLARQFGEGTGMSGPLRNYADPDVRISYDTAFGTHERGSLLVSAVYRAFLAAVTRRTADLVRLATGGSGVLPAGALHPDLVERLTTETCSAARHILKMCIRALDYCPPVDITFGEYLRAIITADFDAVPEDRFGYRVAFLEAFRQYGLLPRSLRTVSVDTLRWRTWHESNGPQPIWLAPAVARLGIDVRSRPSRAEIFDQSEGDGTDEHPGMRNKFRQDVAKGLQRYGGYDLFGLQQGLRYYFSLPQTGQDRGTTLFVESLRVSKRVKANGDLDAKLFVMMRQRRPETLFAGDDSPDAERFWFRGGSTLVIDLLEPGGPQIRYAIRKPIISPSRLARERAHRSGEASDSLRATNFGGDGRAAREPFAAMHAERT